MARPKGSKNKVMKKYEGTELGFVKDYLSKIKRKSFWNLENAGRLVGLMQKGHSLPNISKELKRSRQGVRNFLGELERASEAKMTLEEYFEKGRPFSVYKKKVL